jgi:hypothetical protein
VPTPPPQVASLNGATANLSSDVQLTSASLKIPRPHLLRSLYNHVPSQCLTCGRRFAADAEGKSRKARHLDAHFRTNTRLADAQRRGVSRSWFLDELDWIRSREIDDAVEDIDTAAKGDGGAGVDASTKVVADAGSDLNGGVLGGQRGTGAQKNTMSKHQQMQQWHITHVRYVKKSSRQCGMMEHRNGFGWMQHCKERRRIMLVVLWR